MNDRLTYSLPNFYPKKIVVACFLLALLKIPANNNRHFKGFKLLFRKFETSSICGMLTSEYPHSRIITSKALR